MHHMRLLYTVGDQCTQNTALTTASQPVASIKPKAIRASSQSHLRDNLGFGPGILSLAEGAVS